MDSNATIKQVNSYIKEYDKKLVRSSNIHLDYIVDNKLGHYCYNYVTKDVLSDVTKENFYPHYSNSSHHEQKSPGG